MYGSIPCVVHQKNVFLKERRFVDDREEIVEAGEVSLDLPNVIQKL
jgi:hypothetical protein